MEQDRKDRASFLNFLNFFFARFRVRQLSGEFCFKQSISYWIK
ncbi:hypothetical protein A11S_2199 [Micavibrio aeruginosavorus EPB]|uniref:Uncharacterized protein n=1 Tax=Micavibrio aeruginosavorus EPB TaxID=349215 RepID=M4VKI7_9BACT|nr:hypothetical protein A11S_2199 [Micavibrio aeruginosavorus EPB]